MMAVEYIQANQKEHRHIDVMRKIYLHIDGLIDDKNFTEIDRFILRFVRKKICFQYYVCLLVATFQVKDKLYNYPALFENAKKVGFEEIGKKQTLENLNAIE